MDLHHGDHFKEKKRKFFADFKKKLQARFKKDKGLSPLVKDAHWETARESCFLEAAAADVLGEVIHLKEHERRELLAAICLHEFYREREIATHLPHGRAAIAHALSEVAVRFREAGYSEEVIRLAEAIGDLALFRMRDPEATLLEKIAYYLHGIILGDRLVSLEERIDADEANPDYKELNESGRDFFGGKTYAQVRREVARRVETEVARRTGLEDVKGLPAYLLARVDARV